MKNAPPNRGRLGVVLAAVTVCCLPARAVCDEYQYLADDAQVIMSADLRVAMKTKTFAKLLDLQKMASPKAELDEGMKKALSQVSRITMSFRSTDNTVEEVVVMTTLKPVTIEDVKGWTASKNASKKNVAWKEVKYGKTLIYQETFQFEFNVDEKKELTPVIEGATLFIDDTYVVLGQATRKAKDAAVGEASIALLKKIIDRKKPANLTATMQTAIRGDRATAFLAVDLQSLPARSREDILETFKGFATAADILANAGKVQGLVVQLDEPSKLMISVTLLCGDAAAAGVVKGIGERTLADLKTKLKIAPKFDTPEIQKLVAGFNTLVNAVQVASAGSRVTASVEVDPSIAMDAASGWFFAMGQITAPEPKKK